MENIKRFIGFIQLLFLLLTFCSVFFLIWSSFMIFLKVFLSGIAGIIICYILYEGVTVAQLKKHTSTEF